MLNNQVMDRLYCSKTLNECPRKALMTSAMWKDEFWENLWVDLIPTRDFANRSNVLPTSLKKRILEKNAKGVEVLGTLYRTKTPITFHTIKCQVQDMEIVNKMLWRPESPLNWLIPFLLPCTQFQSWFSMWFESLFRETLSAVIKAGQ